MRLIIITLILLLSACGGDPRPTAKAGRATPGVVASSRPATTSNPARRPRSSDVRLIRIFVTFARQPSRNNASRLPLSGVVALGLGPTINGSLARSAAANPAAWVLRAKYFRAHTGPFNALRLLQAHAARARSDSVGDLGAFDVSLGAHPHCVSPPVPAPEEFEGYRRVSVQPSDESIASCLSWFTVDLFVDDDGRIAAVTLDLWEP